MRLSLLTTADRAYGHFVKITFRTPLEFTNFELTTYQTLRNPGFGDVARRVLRGTCGDPNLVRRTIDSLGWKP